MLTSSPVPLFLILTLAPGMTAPEESTTVPESDVKKLPCACAEALTITVSTAARTSRITLINRSSLKTCKSYRCAECKRLSTVGSTTNLPETNSRPRRRGIAIHKPF